MEVFVMNCVLMPEANVIEAEEKLDCLIYSLQEDWKQYDELQKVFSEENYDVVYCEKLKNICWCLKDAINTLRSVYFVLSLEDFK